MLNQNYLSEISNTIDFQVLKQQILKSLLKQNLVKNLGLQLDTDLVKASSPDLYQHFTQEMNVLYSSNFLVKSEKFEISKNVAGLPRLSFDIFKVGLKMTVKVNFGVKLIEQKSEDLSSGSEAPRDNILDYMMQILTYAKNNGLNPINECQKEISNHSVYDTVFQIKRKIIHIDVKTTAETPLGEGFCLINGAKADVDIRIKGRSYYEILKQDYNYELKDKSSLC